jgi:hypothetical protein
MAGWFDSQGLPDRSPQPRTAAPRGEQTTQPVGAPQSQGGQQGGGGPEPYSDDRFLEIVHQFPPTYEGAQAAAEALDKAFGAGVVTLIDHPTKLDKFRLPGGRIADQMYASGSPAARWNDTLTLERGSAGAGSLGAAGNWQAGIDPSYAFVAGEAQKALESGAAAKGTLLTGGFQKDMAKYMSGLASQEFGNIFNRNMSLADLGLRAAGGASQAGSAYGGQVGNTAANQADANERLLTGAGNARAAGTAGSGQIWGNTIGGIGGAIATNPQVNNWLQRAPWLRGNAGAQVYGTPAGPPVAATPPYITGPVAGDDMWGPVTDDPWGGMGRGSGRPRFGRGGEYS